MKRINNILSYLWLLLLLTVVACSESDEMMDAIRGNEIVLNVNTYVPGIEASSRTAPTTENITSITALAFDGDTTLIKVTEPTLNRDTSNGEDKSLKGTMTLTVPQRTRFIHFIAKNNAKFTEITDSDLGKTARGLLVGRISKITNNSDAASISNALHYWGMLTFASAEELKQKKDVTLYRNMAKLSLHLPGGTDGHIAGILNYNTTGTMVPYIVKNGVTQFEYQTETNHALPPTFEITSDVTADKNLGTVHYLFEEYDDVGDLIYVICKVGSKYYKIALVKPEFTDISNKYYYVIRNMEYKINITGTLDEQLGKDDYSDAVKNGKPINDSQKEQVHLDFEPDEVTMYLDEPGTVIVKIPDGITELQIGYPTERFNAGGIKVGGIDVGNSETSADGKVFIDTYNVEGKSEITLSIDLKESVIDAISGMEIQFKGNGENKRADDKLIVNVLKRDDLNVTPSSIEIPKTAGSKFTVKVIIPSFDNYDGVYELSVNDTDNKFNMTAPGNLVLQDGVYNVEKGQTYTFEFELREDGTVNDTHNINFHLDTEYHHYDGETTVKLIDNTVEEYDEYDIWVENGAWTGSTNAVEFFGYKSSNANNGFQTASSPDALRTEYYDEDANQHHTTPMLMSNDDSFTFTIPEGGMWLTMLVASNNTNPSINLFNNNGQPWTTSPDDANATTVKDTYNFGNGEINTDGRLIRYQLPAGTYTLQGSAVEYLLYYMRVTKVKPEMTDVAQPQVTDYELSWSGNGGQYLKDQNNNDNGSKYFVDDNATTFDAKLSYQGLNNVSLSTMNLKVESLLHSFADQDQNGNNISPTDVTSNTESRSYNQISPTLAYNAGAYNLSGTINLGNESTYKYAAFYDVVQLKPVDFTVKNTIKVGLYHSWNEDATSITEYTNGLPYIVGFKMPPVLPNNVYVDNNTVSPIVFTIDSNWKVQSSGLGVEANNGNYRLTSQTQTNNDTQYQRVHPRPNWNYKIQWENVVSNNLTPTLTNVNENKDIYFSYNGTITKNPSIATSISSDKLDIELDFYQTENENKPDGTTYNLDFTNDSFYLKATISQTDAAKYAGAQVNLQGEFTSESGGGHNSIHWWNSRQGGNSSIGYDNNNNGTGLRFTIQEGQTEYKIEWKFVRPNDSQSTVPVQFTYTVKNDLYNMTGDTKATIILGGNQAGGNELDITLNFSYDVDGNYNFTNNTSMTNLKLNTSRVRLTATISQEDAQAFKGKTIYLKGVYSSINGANDGYAIHWVNSRQDNSSINYSSPDFNGLGLEFKIDSNNPLTTYYIEWIFETGGQYPGYGDIEFTYNVTNSQGTGSQSATIAFTNEPVLEFMFNFNDNNDTSDDGKNKQLYGWFTTFNNTVVTNGERRFENNALVLHNEHVNVSNGIQESLSQAAVDVAFENGKSYTLIIKVKSDDQTTIYNNFSNNLPIILQDDNQDSNWPKCGDFKTESNDDLTFSTEWQTVKVTTKANGTPTKGRVVINFGHIIGNIYIDDLILVRND